MYLAFKVARTMSGMESGFLPSRILKRWKVLPPVGYDRRIEIGCDDLFPILTIGEDFPVRIDGQAPSVVGQFRIAATAVHPDDKRLILDRPCSQQCHPVINASDRPIGDDDEKRCSASRRRAERFGKPQVITDQRCDHQAAPVEGRYLRTRGVNLSFASKWMMLRKPRKQPIGSECNRFITDIPIRTL